MFGIPTPAGLSLSMALKLGALGLALALGLGGGCKWQAGRDADKFDAQAKAHAGAIAKKNKALTAAATQLEADGRQLHAVADALRQVTANTAIELAKAKEQARIGELAAAQARRDRHLFELRLSELDRARERAKADSPQCRAQLEAPLCADLL